MLLGAAGCIDERNSLGNDVVFTVTARWRLDVVQYVKVTTLSGVDYASVTCIIHSRHCCNLLIS